MWDVKDLGLKATQRIVKAKNPLRLLADISQNFPLRAVPLAKVKLDKRVRAEVLKKQKGGDIEPGHNQITMNGRVIDLASTSLATLVQTIRSECDLLEALGKQHLSQKAAMRVLSPPAGPAGDSSGSDDLSFRIDYRPYEAGAVVWANDIEGDDMCVGL